MADNAYALKYNSGMKGNQYKKYTFEDRFDRRYACWCINEHKAFAWWKRYNRRKYRRVMKMKLKKELSSDTEQQEQGE